MSEFAHQTYVVARKVVIGLIGGTITLIGIAMILLPGPAFIQQIMRRLIPPLQ